MLVDPPKQHWHYSSFFFFSFHILFSQKGFAYDFEFLHAFLSNKKDKICPTKNGGGDHPFTPQIVIPVWTAGGVRALWVFEYPPRCMHIRYYFGDMDIRSQLLVWGYGDQSSFIRMYIYGDQYLIIRFGICRLYIRLGICRLVISYQSGELEISQ